MSTTLQQLQTKHSNDVKTSLEQKQVSLQNHFSELLYYREVVSIHGWLR